MLKDIICMAIDDEPMALSVISGFCERKGGYELTVFTDPEEAFSRLDEIRPELVFLDIEMGEISGLDVAKRLPKGQNSVDNHRVDSGVHGFLRMSGCPKYCIQS